MSQSPAPEPGDRYRTVSRYVFFGFLIVAGYFLLAEHRAHILPFLPFLPFLLVAACPLMHLFHHHGHSDEDSTADEKSPPRSGDGAHQH